MGIHFEMRAIGDLTPHKRNARTHPEAQLGKIAKSIQKFGFTSPVLINDHGVILAGHGRVEAAKLAGLEAVPVVLISHLSDVEQRAYMLADNKLAQLAGYNEDLLAEELQDLVNLNWDIDLTGFTMAETDLILDAAQARKSDPKLHDDDIVPETSLEPVSRPGDVWILGPHKVVCGDSRSGDTYKGFGDERPYDLMFADVPYNVPIQGNVCGSGKTKHREFAMASGEMSPLEYTTFLAVTLSIAATSLRNGAISFVCIDWRHYKELIEAGQIAFEEYKQLCVWNKTNGGMGTFYRSKHELILVFKSGTAPHINNFGLGENGRYRTNVWDYPGISSVSKTRSSELAMHPTVKPVKLVLDAIEDCSKRGDFVLDPFAGSGTTLIAAERCGRVARVIEYDPGYCDTIIARYRAATGKVATLGEKGPSFDEVAKGRRSIQGEIK
jgi:DNA modification methylase